MNIREMHDLFRLKLNKIDSFQYFSFEPEEIDLMLNDAQEQYLSTRYSGNNPMKQGFEETQKRVDDLAALVNYKQYKITDNTYYEPIFQNYRIPISELIESGDSYFHNISLAARYAGKDCVDQFGREKASIVTIRFVQHDDINTVFLDPHWTPTFQYPLYTQLSDRYEIYFGSEIDFTKGTEVNILHKYLKKASKVKYPDVDCQLFEHTHREIVNIAVSMALESIEDPRNKTFYQQNLLTTE
jgi:hypothetical protein